MLEAFVAETGWTPAVRHPVAGALASLEYNFLVKLVMKRIARHNGASTDTSRDWEFTDWPAVDGFVRVTTEHAPASRARVEAGMSTASLVHNAGSRAGATCLADAAGVNTVVEVLRVCRYSSERS